MKFLLTLTPTPLSQIDAALIILLLHEEGLAIGQSISLDELSAATGLDARALCAEEGFLAKAGQTLMWRGLSGLKARRVLLVGLGAGAALTPAIARDAAARAARIAAKARFTTLAIQAPAGADATLFITQLATGVAQGSYDFTAYRSVKDDDFLGIQAVELIIEGDASGQDALERAEYLAKGVRLTRELVNSPPQELYPETLAEHARQVGARGGLSTTILNEVELEARGFNLIMAVGKGSARQPRLIHLVYTPEGPVRHKIALVGKGVTFDTGGYSLKPSDSMYNMHCDMAGAAAVIGAAEVIGQLKPAGIEVHFIVPAAENMVSGNAMRVNDIYRGYGGKTVEIGNTDAEGRLILADALAYAQEQQVHTIIDLATLTGACMIALGDYTSGLFTDSDVLHGELTEAITRSSEDFWRLPLHKKLDKLIDSPVADMKNVGKRVGGAITAALFLKRWVHIDRWAHLDIAGPAFADGESDALAAGGTGFGVLTLVELIELLGVK